MICIEKRRRDLSVVIFYTVYLFNKSTLWNQINAGALLRSHSEVAVKESAHMTFRNPGDWDAQRIMKIIRFFCASNIGLLRVAGKRKQKRSSPSLRDFLQKALPGTIFEW